MTSPGYDVITAHRKKLIKIKGKVMEFDLVYCVVYDYFEELDVIQVFTDKAEAEAMAAKMGSATSVMESKIRKNNDANN